MTRFVLAAFAAVVLAGCNQITTDKPLFSAADANGAPRLREGVWAREAPDCAFDDKLPATSWPHCAGPLVVRGDQALLWDDGKWHPMGYVLTAGQPRVVQLDMTADGSGDNGFAYGGLKPLKFAADGRVIAFRAWQAMCGPPPAPDAKKGDPRVLLTGLEARGGDCTASRPEPVRAAAAASEPWDKQPLTARWVRDGWN